MDLKTKIFDKVEAARTGQKTIDEATNEILLLLGVVGRSEQLLAFAQYMCEHQNNLDGKTAKDYLQDFLSQ